VKENRDTRLIGGWMGHKIGLNEVEKTKLFTLPGLELRPVGQSLYRLRTVLAEMDVGNLLDDRDVNANII
jgi:hypothetical protein